MELIDGAGTHACRPRPLGWAHDETRAPQTPWSLAPADAGGRRRARARHGALARSPRACSSRAASTTAEQVERFLSPDLDRDWLDPVAHPGMRRGGRAGRRGGSRRRAHRRLRRLRPRRRLVGAPSRPADCARWARRQRDRPAPLQRGLRALGGRDRAAAAARARPRRHRRLRHLLGAPRSRLLAEQGVARRRHRPPRARRPACPSASRSPTPSSTRTTARRATCPARASRSSSCRPSAGGSASRTRGASSPISRRSAPSPTSSR